MKLTCGNCGSDQWTITAEINVGYTVPVTSVAAWTRISIPTPDREPKCAQCGHPLPSFAELMAAKQNDTHPYERAPR